MLAASAAAAQEPVAPPQSGPVTRQSAVRENPLLDFEYSWPEAISPDTKLVDLLKADLIAGIGGPDEVALVVDDDGRVCERLGGLGYRVRVFP